MTEQTQQEFLKAGKEELGVTWDEFALLADIDPRAFKTYRMPENSQNYRAMNRFVRDAIVRLLERRRKKGNKTA